MQAPDDECIFIKATLSRLSEEVDSLCTREARLRQRLNTLRASTSILPVETLVSIFGYARRWKYHRNPRIGSVCSYWRNVLHSTPSLWTSVSLHYTQRNAVDLLLHQHQCSGGIPLAIKLSKQRNTSNVDNTPLLPILLLDPNISHNIRSLGFDDINPVIWSVIELHAIDASFPQLENLTLIFRTSHPCRLMARKTLFPGSPLKKISLRFAMPGLEDKLPLENVTHIEGRGQINGLHRAGDAAPFSLYNDCWV